MFSTQRRVARVCMVLAGIIFLGETLFGCFAVLGLGLGTAQDIILGLCLTMSFPIFLISFRSRIIALVALWIFFIGQWIDMDLLSRPPLLNPLNDWHSNMLFTGIALFTIACILTCLSPNEKENRRAC
jgi:hypothetical protein